MTNLQHLKDLLSKASSNMRERRTLGPYFIGGFVRCPWAEHARAILTRTEGGR